MPTYLSPGVYVEEVAAGSRPIEGVGTSVAAFVGLAAKGPVNEPTLVSNWTQFTEAFGDFVESSYLAHAVYGWFLNGGGNCFVVRIAADSGNGSRPKAIAAPKQATIGGYTATSIAKGATANKNIEIGVQPAGGESPPDDEFKLVVLVDGKSTETYGNVTTKAGDNNVATKVNAASKLINLEETNPGSALTPIAKGQSTMAAPEPVPVPPSTDNLGPATTSATPRRRTGFGGLEAVDEVTMVAVPDLAAALEQRRHRPGDVQGRPARDDRALRADGRPDRDPGHTARPEPPGDPQVAYRRRRLRLEVRVALLALGQGLRPGHGRQQFVPPSGHMAGVWARNDDTRGVHKAPANEVVRGAISLQTQITRAEHDLLNPVGINCVRVFPGRGVRVWGARTLASDAEWRYLNVRRLFNYLEESILLGTQWVVFEPNDHALWARIRRTISAFLVNEWRKGALFGTTPDEAFFVKCDDETNPAEGIDAGQVVCQIGVAPVKPAEFVIFQLSQFSGGTSLVSE